MERRNGFTLQEIELIEQLIALKCQSDRNMQKKIRKKLREKICFYIEDYTNSKKGYDVDDLKEDIKNGNIQIIKEE